MELSKRFRRPHWTDARLLVGAVLVVLAVIATYLLVEAATSTMRVWASASSLVPGQEVESDDLVVAEVNLADVGDRYVSADSPLPPDSSVRTVVAPGELLAASALVPLPELSGRTVAIDVAGSVPSGIDTGSLVDVWAVPESNGLDEVEAEPRQIVTSAPVANISRETGSFGVGDGARIEVFVPLDELAGLLTVLDGNSILSVVGAPGAVAGSGR